MSRESPLGVISPLSEQTCGVFRGCAAVALGVSRKQLATLRASGVIEQVLPDTFRVTAVARSSEQELWAALLWAGENAAAAGRSAGEVYRLEGVRAARPEIVIPRSARTRSPLVITHRPHDHAAMRRQYRGFPVTGVEPTIVALAAGLDGEAFEIAFEDARRRRLTSIAALHAYLDRFAKRGTPGVGATREVLAALDPVHPARSTLEVKTRRLLVASGITNFVREYPLQWNGRTYWFDFGFQRERVILETNGRRWHDDATDYEHDNEKWSVPGRLGYRIVFATWAKVTRHPKQLLDELGTTLQQV